MSIVMAGLSPHPPLIIPEIGGKRREKVRQTIQSLQELSSEIKEKDPDLIITISPHGAVFTDAVSILDQKLLKGDFAAFSYPEVELTVPNKLDILKKLKNRAALKGIEVLTLSGADIEQYNYPEKLDHGVLVPLYYLQEAGVNTPLIPITMGLLNYEKLYDFGCIIQQTVDKAGLDTVIIASGDLSHRLKPGAPAGFNPRGAEFDKKVMGFLESGDYQKVLEIDPHLIEKAGECGLRPIIIMLGALNGLNASSDLKSYEGPFGVGYGVAAFYPEE